MSAPRPISTATLHCHEVAGLQRLGWLAIVEPRRTEGGEGGRRVRVYHGTAVERRDEWIVEGTWDAEFRNGDFHQSNHFFGTGIRVDGGAVHFVPSSALVNRLIYCDYRDHLVVSNSLALMLGFTGAALDPAHDYRAETYAIRQGPAAYQRAFRVLHPEIVTFYQVYDESLVVAGSEIRFESRRTAPALASFEQYRALVEDALQKLRANYASPERRAPMGAFATISSGYDSTAAAVLIKDLGIELCFTSRRSNSHIPPWLSPQAGLDDGKPVADLLGLRTEYLERRRSRITDDELYFLAPGCAPTSTALHSLARHLEQRDGAAVVYTGFQGDEVWDTNPWERVYQDRGVLRGDTAALMLSEIRLKCGMVNIAVPSLFARSIRDLAVIATSPEMARWRVPGDYDRPIPRRILESAGVPGRLYGGRKKAVVERPTYPMQRELRRQFFAYLRGTQNCSALFVHLHGVLNSVAWPFVRSWHLMRKKLFKIEPPNTPWAYLWPRVDFPRALFIWAASVLAARFATQLDAAGVKQPGSTRRNSPPPPPPPSPPPHQAPTMASAVELGEERLAQGWRR